MGNEKDQISGGAIETVSSDSHIKRNASALRREVYGVSDEIIEISLGKDDVYEPKCLTSTSDAEGQPNHARSVARLSKLTPNHSAVGLKLHQERGRKKAA